MARLDYYGRSLEIDSSAGGDTRRLPEVARSVRRTWDALRPRVMTRGGRTAASRFDMLVAELEAARSVEAYSRLAATFLEEVDRLERVIQ